jgi:RsiW-degrading membrane proteinase PrsW (M82 family)
MTPSSTQGIPKKPLLYVFALSVLMLLATGVSAIIAVKDIVCSVIASVWWALAAIGPSMVLLMFLYGGTKYAYSADDPGGRKTAKNICIHAVIGGILMLLASALYDQLFKTATEFSKCWT